MFHPIVNRSKQLPSSSSRAGGADHLFRAPATSTGKHRYAARTRRIDVHESPGIRVPEKEEEEEEEAVKRWRGRGGITDHPKIIANSVPQNLRSMSYVRVPNLTLSSNFRQLDSPFSP